MSGTRLISIQRYFLLIFEFLLWISKMVLDVWYTGFAASPTSPFISATTIENQHRSSESTPAVIFCHPQNSNFYHSLIRKWQKTFVL